MKEEYQITDRKDSWALAQVLKLRRAIGTPPDDGYCIRMTRADPDGPDGNDTQS